MEEVAWEESLSPFDIDMILEAIFRAMVSTDLWRARLVSKRWAEVATKELQMKRIQKSIYLNHQRIGKFTSTMENSWTLPFQEYHLAFDLYFSDENFRKFFQVCGGSVKTLSFDMRSWAPLRASPDCSTLLELLQKEKLSFKDNFFQNVLLTLSNTLENLDFNLMPFSKWGTRVSVRCTREIVIISFLDGSIVMECASQNLADFLSRAFGFYKALTGEQLYYYEDRPYTPLLKSFGILDLVTKLDLITLFDKDLENLLDSNVALKELSVFLEPYTPIRVNLLESFLKIQSKSLKAFTLSYTVGHDRLKLPKMPGLTELKTFAVGGDNLHFMTFEGLDLFRDLPNLRHLTLVSRSPFLENSYFEYFAPSKKSHIRPFTKLESLHVCFGKVDVEFISYLGAQFPNIRKLKLECKTKEMLSAAFAVADWGLNLKELIIDFHFLRKGQARNSRDCILCGIPYKWRRDVGEKLLMDNDQRALLKEAEAWNQGPRGIGGISRFTNLETLNVLNRQEGSCDKYFISDLTVYFSLVKLKRLRSLSMDPTRVTPEAVQYLKENCPLLRSFKL